MRQGYRLGSLLCVLAVACGGPADEESDSSTGAMHVSSQPETSSYDNKVKSAVQGAIAGKSLKVRTSASLRKGASGDWTTSQIIPLAAPLDAVDPMSPPEYFSCELSYAAPEGTGSVVLDSGDVFAIDSVSNIVVSSPPRVYQIISFDLSLSGQGNTLSGRCQLQRGNYQHYHTDFTLE
jgi:hypothetical protein